MGVSGQTYLEWVALPPPGDLPDPGMEPSPPALHADSLPSEPPGKPQLGSGSVHKEILFRTFGRKSVPERSVFFPENPKRASGDVWNSIDLSGPDSGETHPISA